jgi:hypothetical protein
MMYMKRLYYLLISVLYSIPVFSQVETINESISENVKSYKSSLKTIESKSSFFMGSEGAYFSGKNVRLLTGFRAEKGSNFKAGVREESYLKSNVRVFPNPFKNGFEIEINLMENTKVSIDLRNVKGQLIKYIINEEFMEKGKVSRSILMDDLVDGTYFVTVRTPYFSDNIKVIKLQ